MTTTSHMMQDAINNISVTTTINVRKVSNTCIIKKNSICVPVSCDDNESIVSYQGLIHRYNNSKRQRAQFTGVDSAACLVSNKYKFVYIHVLKSGGSSIKTYMEQCLCNNENKTCNPNIYELRQCTDIIFSDDEYFIFTFVRNPYSRMVSNYFFRQAHKTILWKHYGNKMPISFKQFVKNPSLMDKYSYTSKPHLFPQIQFIFNANKCPSIDYIGKLENMKQEFEFIMQYIWDKYNAFPMEKCTDVMNKSHKLNGWTKQSLTYSNKTSWKDMYGNNTQISNGVVKMYHDDFSLFGYDTNII